MLSEVRDASMLLFSETNVRSPRPDKLHRLDRCKTRAPNRFSALILHERKSQCDGWYLRYAACARDSNTQRTHCGLGRLCSERTPCLLNFANPGLENTHFKYEYKLMVPQN